MVGLEVHEVEERPAGTMGHAWSHAVTALRAPSSLTPRGPRLKPPPETSGILNQQAPIA